MINKVQCIQHKSKQVFESNLDVDDSYSGQLPTGIDIWKDGDKEKDSCRCLSVFKPSTVSIQKFNIQIDNTTNKVTNAQTLYSFLRK